MNLTPLYESSWVIQFHVYAAVLAIGLGIYVLSGTKGTTRHKAIGRVWVLAMVCIAVSSFWIHEIRLLGSFSPIHLLSILVLVALYRAVRAIRSGRVKEHQNSMKWLFFAGLLFPGALTFLPDRLMSKVFFEPVLATNMASADAVSILDQVMLHTPLWIWPLIFAFAIFGYRKAKSRKPNISN